MFEILITTVLPIVSELGALIALGISVVPALMTLKEPPPVTLMEAHKKCYLYLVIPESACALVAVLVANIALATESAAWIRAKHADAFLSYSAFLSKYPASRYRTAVVQRLQKASHLDPKILPVAIASEQAEAVAGGSTSLSTVSFSLDGCAQFHDFREQAALTISAALRGYALTVVPRNGNGHVSISCKESPGALYRWRHFRNSYEDIGPGVRATNLHIRLAYTTKKGQLYKAEFDAIPDDKPQWSSPVPETAQGATAALTDDVTARALRGLRTELYVEPFSPGSGNHGPDPIFFGLVFGVILIVATGLSPLSYVSLTNALRDYNKTVVNVGVVTILVGSYFWVLYLFVRLIVGMFTDQVACYYVQIPAFL